jgi:hypothetical protein
LARDARRRPLSALAGTKKVGGEVRWTAPANSFHPLHEGIALLRLMSRHDLEQELLAPKRERARREALREDVKAELLRQTRTRSFSMQRLRQQMYFSADDEPRIDRAGFVDAMRTTGIALGGGVVIYSRLFSSFDVGITHTVLIEEVLHFLHDVQCAAKALGSVRKAPPPMVFLVS